MSPHILRAIDLGPTYWLEDNFDEATTVTLDQHTPDIAPVGAWGTSVGTDNTEYQVVGGAGYVNDDPSAGAAPWAAYPATVGPDVRLTLTVDFNDAIESGSDRIYIGVRCTGFGGFGDYEGYFWRVNANGTVVFFKATAGTSTVLYDNAGSAAISPPGSGDHTMSIEAVGDTIKVFWDDVEIASVTDTDHTAAGYIRWCNYGANDAMQKRITVEEL